MFTASNMIILKYIFHVSQSIKMACTVYNYTITKMNVVYYFFLVPELCYLKNNNTV